MESNNTTKAMAHTQSYFLSHDSTANQRKQMAMYTMANVMPATPVYSRPGSSCAQFPTLYGNGPSVLTPTGSPHLVNIKPKMLDTAMVSGSYFPSTPPLSASGSTVGSPKSADALQTPMNPMFSGMDGVGSSFNISDSAENSILDWSGSGSPPMTPVYLPQTHSQNGSSFTSDNDLVSAGSCPSLSPSPAPFDAADVSFCDPRDLTVSSVSALVTPDFPLVLSEDEFKLDPSKLDSSVTTPTALQFTPAIPSGLPAFGDLSDIESETEFGNSLLDFSNADSADHGRPRACTGSSIVSLGHASFIGEEDLIFDETESLNLTPLPTAQPCSEDCHKDKRLKKSHNPEQSSTVMASSSAPATNEGEDVPEDQTQEVEDSATGSDSNDSSEFDSSTAPQQAPARRGRKQSLTEDPSKTFVCDLCSRRFRRQEHLKRHYRSLHTHDKPFECDECGKKFSRSDNLAQHARTHGSGAIVMKLLEDGETPVYDEMMPIGPNEDYGTFGKVLFQIASEIPGSASDGSSEDNSQAKKKRKRSD